MALTPEYTSQDCSTCGNSVKKSLSVRIHICSSRTLLYSGSRKDEVFTN
ncbi:zinc ribbon domain-containing protein [Microcoleus sp. AR_TQ3_B6]